MSLNQPIDFDDVRTSIARSLHDHWALYFIEGLVLLALGTTAILVPPIATVGVTIVIGWTLAASGVMGLVTTYAGRRAPGFWWSLLSAVLGLVAGLVLLAWPGRGAVSLTVVLIAFFFAEGVASVMFGLAHRRHLSSWRFMVATGVVDLVLATIILAGLPGTAAWTLGLLVGINMLFGGAALSAVALHASRSVRR
jgi:uncharacterized membrane protein HdeD (DUF308 family)